LNKPELYYTKTQLKDMKCDALLYAKSHEEVQEDSFTIATGELRGCEGVAPNLLRIKLERRKQGREVVMQEQAKQKEEHQGVVDTDRLAELYHEVTREAVQALQVAEQDSKVAKEIHTLDQELTSLLLLLIEMKKEEEEEELYISEQSPGHGQVLLSIESNYSNGRKESSSLHTDFSSVSSDVIEDLDLSSNQIKHPRQAQSLPSSLRLKKAISYLGRRLRRGSNAKLTSSSSSSSTLMNPVRL
jgi:hypothetical protein